MTLRTRSTGWKTPQVPSKHVLTDWWKSLRGQQEKRAVGTRSRGLGIEPLEQRQLLALTFQVTPYQEDGTTKHLQVNYHLDTAAAPFEIALIAIDADDEGESGYTVLSQTASDLSPGNHSFTFSMPLSGTIGGERTLKVVLDPAGTNSSVTFAGGFRDSAGQVYVFGGGSSETITASESAASLDVTIGSATYSYSRTDAIGVSKLNIWGMNGNDQILQSTTAISTPLGLYGGNGSDRLYASNGNATIDGGEGNDELYGGNNAASTYTLKGKANNDTLTARLGSTILEPGSGTNSVYAGPGSNTVVGDGGASNVFGGDATGGINITGTGTTTLSLNFTDNVAHNLNFVSANASGASLLFRDTKLTCFGIAQRPRRFHSPVPCKMLSPPATTRDSRR